MEFLDPVIFSALEPSRHARLISGQRHSHGQKPKVCRGTSRSRRQLCTFSYTDYVGTESGRKQLITNKRGTAAVGTSVGSTTIGASKPRSGALPVSIVISRAVVSAYPLVQRIQADQLRVLPSQGSHHVGQTMQSPRHFPDGVCWLERNRPI